MRSSVYVRVYIRARKFLIVFKMFGCATILQVWFSGCPLFRGNFVLKNHVGSSNLVRCPESRSVRLSEVIMHQQTTIVISIRNTTFVRCGEVVRFSEGPLREVRLQLYIHKRKDQHSKDCYYGAYYMKQCKNGIEWGFNYAIVLTTFVERYPNISDIKKYYNNLICQHTFLS